MKILYLTVLLSPYRVEWMNALLIDNDVVAYYISSEEKTRERDWLNSQKPSFPTKRVPRSKLFKELPAKSFLTEVLFGNFDIYIIDGYSSLIKLKTMNKLLKEHKKVFINIDGIDIWRKRSKADIIKDFVKRRVFRSGAYFLCGSKIAQKTLIEGGAEEDKVFVHPFTSLHKEDIILPNQKCALQKEYKEKLNLSGKKAALAVGRFIPLKKYDVLIKAWQDMPNDCVLYIIGGGEERDNYERLIKESGVKNIVLIDFLLPQKLSEYFCAADIFVHPSSTETWGLVINEAMAKGCPVIATDHCVAARELIKDGENGFLTKVGDVAQLRQKMCDVLFDDPLREKMMRNAVKTIEPYTYENLAETHLRIFRNELNR